MVPILKVVFNLVIETNNIVYHRRKKKLTNSMINIYQQSIFLHFSGAFHEVMWVVELNNEIIVNFKYKKR